MLKLFSIFLIISSVTIFANEGYELVKELNLNPASKVKRQWNRVFKREVKMKEYGIDKLTSEQKEVLKEYLLDHAADSDHPEKAGI